MTFPSNTETTVEDNGLVRQLRGRIPLPAMAGDAPTATSVAEGVVAVLTDLSEDLQIAPSESIDLTVTKVDEREDAVTVRLSETVDGRPVYGSDIVTEVQGAALTHVGVARFDNRVSSPPVAEAADSPLTRRRAINLVMRDLGADTVVHSDAMEVYFPAEDGLHRSWCVNVVTDDADWQYVVNAATEEVYVAQDQRFHVNGRGRVFAPNPVVTANDNTFREGVTPAATLNAELVQVDLFDITQDGGNHRLEGPWARIVNKQDPPIAPPEQASTDFFFERDDDDFEAVNVYHHIDRIQRYFRDVLGVTNAAAFSIECDHHTVGGAFYSPGGKFLGFGDSGAGRPDRGEDGDVMAHEYGHAIQDDLVPGWGVSNPTTQRQEARAMGEGFGDALACILNQEAGGLFQQEVFEDWIFADIGGLRRVDGIKTYPGEGTTGTTGDWVDQVHADGEIWSAALWSTYLAAGGSSSSATTREQVRQEFLRTLLLHHTKLNTNATMPEAARALLEQNASDPRTGGRQVRDLLDAFQDRNILVSQPGVDLWIKDRPADIGAEFSGSPFWNSPDVWVRNADDGGTTHQNAEFGQDNWLYAKVRNRGTQAARAFAVTFEVKIFQGTEFSYPADFLPALATGVGFNLAPGAEQVIKARWPKADVPAAGAHGCVLVSAYSPVDESAQNTHVWEDNNLAQKNLTIVDLKPDATADVTFRLGNRLNFQPELFRIEVARPAGQEALRLEIAHPNKVVIAQLAQSVETIDLEKLDPSGLGSAAGGPDRPTSGAVGGVAVTSRPGGSAPMLSPVLTILEAARVHLGLGDAGEGEGLEISLAPGSEIHPQPHVNGQRQASGDALPADPAFLANDTHMADDASRGGLFSLVFNAGRLVGLPVLLPARLGPPLRLRVTAPAGARRGDVHTVDLIQRDRRGRAVGGISVQVNVI